ncbi:MFS transporter [Bradyrhizobium barranii]|uniref:MFS transporter n=1 Tax=Bradyrhizobium barranii TaxID=2992140 RepID=UPI003D15FAAC
MDFTRHYLGGDYTLATLASLGPLTPNLLLAACFAAGRSAAMLRPALQAAVIEQVPAQALPAAVAPNGISYNIARTVDPAIGGVIVATVDLCGVRTQCRVLSAAQRSAQSVGARTERSRLLPRTDRPRDSFSGGRDIATRPRLWSC